jgi:hypothetical protein
LQSILVPRNLDLRSALHFGNKIEELLPQDEICFDFGELQWVYPFGMLFLAQAVKNLRNRFPDCLIHCENLNDSRATSYAAHVSFFTSCGFSIGNDPGFRSSSSTYIPITYARSSQLRTTNAIEDISRELAEQLAQQSSGSIVDVLEYSFREMIRNVIEHSESPILGYCAQYWPKNGQVEVAILDSGIGLRQSLSENPHLPLESDRDAVKYALMPGISGKTYTGVRIRPTDVWQNSGYGLYMNYRLCNQGGSFFICSGTRGLYRSAESENTYYETNYKGTALRLKLNVDALGDVKRLLKQFSDEGEYHAKRLGLGAMPTASTMSKMLRDNFRSVDVKVEVGDTVRHRQFGEGNVTEKLVTPQGEMLWISFNGGRRKKILTKDVIVIARDGETFSNEEFEIHDMVEIIDFDDFDGETKSPEVDEDSFFDEGSF